MGTAARALHRMTLAGEWNTADPADASPKCSCFVSVVLRLAENVSIFARLRLCRGVWMRRCRLFPVRSSPIALERGHLEPIISGFAAEPGGCSSVGRARRCQRRCRGFEPHHPLFASLLRVGTSLHGVIMSDTENHDPDKALLNTGEAAGGEAEAGGDAEEVKEKLCAGGEGRSPQHLRATRYGYHPARGYRSLLQQGVHRTHAHGPRAGLPPGPRCASWWKTASARISLKR